MPYGTYDANWVSKFSRLGSRPGVGGRSYAPTPQYNHAQTTAPHYVDYLAQPYLSREPETTQQIIEPPPYVQPSSLINTPIATTAPVAINSSIDTIIQKYSQPQAQPIIAQPKIETAPYIQAPSNYMNESMFESTWEEAAKAFKLLYKPDEWNSGKWKSFVEDFMRKKGFAPAVEDRAGYARAY